MATSIWDPKSINVIDALYMLDAHLSGPETIILCGSAVPILLGFQFRQTHAVDFAFLPSPIISATIQNSVELSKLFDFRSAAVVGLFIDCDYRFWRVAQPFRNLSVLCLSLEDWVVSKLASPKVDDVLNVTGVTLDMLYWIRDNFGLYGGVSTVRAESDLLFLIREFEKRAGL